MEPIVKIKAIKSDDSNEGVLKLTPENVFNGSEITQIMHDAVKLRLIMK
jgi:hypothetical protein